MTEIDSLLAEIPDFRDFEPSELRDLATHARIEEYPAGSTIFQEEDVADEVIVILEGEVSVQNAIPGSDPVLIETLGPGDFLGWAWLMPPFQRLSDAIAVTDVRLLALDAVGVRSLCNAHPTVGFRLYQAWLPHLADRFRAQRLQLLAALGRG